MKSVGNLTMHNMKTKLFFIYLFAILVCGCRQDELYIDQSVNERTFTASFEQNSTRTYVEEGNLLRWTEGDQISLFDGNTLNRQYKFDGKTGDNAGTFSIVNAPYGSGNDLSTNYAVYPYASDIMISEEGVITMTFPTEQNYAEDSFGLGANTMVAVTGNNEDTFLKFKNACGYLKLQLYGDDVTIKSITLTGNNNEKLAGKATITPSYNGGPTISMADNAVKTITLDCKEGVEIGVTAESATDFWIVIPPTTFKDGFEVTITDIYGCSFTKSTAKEIAITRNKIQPMSCFKVEMVIPNNQIWYTSSDGNVITPGKNTFSAITGSANVFATITSNVYVNGKGVITFDCDIDEITSFAFDSFTTLTSVTIPNSVTYVGSKAFWNCTSLISVELPNSITSIGDAFVNCSSLTKVSLPNGLTEIPSQLFYGCSSLSEVTIPEGVTKIGQSAFYGCSSLSAITIPNSVTTIQQFAFAATGIINFTFPNKIKTISAHSVYNCPSLENITIPSTVTTIEYSAFFANSALKTVRIYATQPPTITNGNAIFNGNTHTTCVLEVPKGRSSVYYNSTGWAFSTIREIQ